VCVVGNVWNIDLFHSMYISMVGSTLQQSPGFSELSQQPNTTFHLLYAGLIEENAFTGLVSQHCTCLGTDEMR
jgi:hypothetical protein